MRSQRPSRCSCPIAQSRNRPSDAKARPFVKPASPGRVPTCSRLRRGLSAARHSRTQPSDDPDATRSDVRTDASELIHGILLPLLVLLRKLLVLSSSSPSPKPVASTCITGFFLVVPQIARRPLSSPVTKVSSVSMRQHSSDVLTEEPRKTNCLSSAHFH